jgi:hypothetical protein
MSVLILFGKKKIYFKKIPLILDMFLKILIFIYFENLK